MSLTINKILNKEVPLSVNISSKLTDDIIEDLKKYENGIDSKKVYQKNVFHGLHHSEKVMMFTYLLGKKLNLTEEDLKIVVDAAIYHDMGRENDYEDTFHGYVSSLRVREVTRNQEFYKDQEKQKMLEAIIDMHSLEDKFYRRTCENHEIEEQEYERFEKLSKILKDADALDRLRFGRKSPASLKEKYLRFDYSKELISLAKDINEIYFNELQRQNRIKIEQINERESNPCFHSIGFDFFKIESIIRNGILSKQAMRELGIEVPRNFQGGNLENWISVVDASMGLNGKAYREFTSNGIGFFCLANKLFLPIDSYAKAIETGYPYNKSSYEDEKYVYSKIDPEDIIFLIIPKEYGTKDIRELNYIYNTLNKDLLIEKISYYVHKTNTIITSKNAIELLKATEEYVKELEIYETVDLYFENKMDEAMLNLLNRKLANINSVLQKMMYEYYSEKLNRKNKEIITTTDAVTYTLLEMNYPCPVTITEDEVLFQINEVKLEKQL